MKKICLLVAVTFYFPAFAQINLKGIVLDNNNQGIENVSVFTEWEENGALKRSFNQTLEDGSFWLTTNNFPCKITVEKFGFTSQTKTISDANYLRIQLKSSDNTRQLKPVVLSSIRANNNKTSETMVSSAMLQTQNAALDLPMLLNFQPSVTTTSDAGNGIGYSGIRIRGTDASRINVTLNGIPMNDAEAQGVFWVNTPDLASGLNNIQITRGVGSSTNGGSAFGGTVSMETDDPATAPNRVEFAYGSFNSMRTTIAANTGLVGGFAGGIRVSNISSDGFVDRASSQLQSYQINLAYQTNKTKLRFIHLKGSERTYQSWYGLDPSLLRTDRTFNLAGYYENANGEAQFYNNQTDNYGQSHYQLFADRSIIEEDGLSVSASVGLHYTKGAGYYEEYQENQNLLNYNQDSGTTDLVRQLWLQNDFIGRVYSLNITTPKYSVLFGGGVHHYYGNHFGNIIRADLGSAVNFDERYYDSDATKREWSNYVKWTGNITRARYNWKVFADLQVRNINYMARGINDDQTPIDFNNNFTFVNPKVGFSATTRGKKTSKAWNVFVGVGNREPSRTDFLQSEAEPKAEQMINLEVGKAYYNKKWAFTANYYMMAYQNQLVLTGQVNNVGTPLRANVGQSYRTGLELIGEYTLTEKIKFGGNLTLSQNKVLEYNEVLYDESFNYVQTINRTNTNLAYSPNVVSALHFNYKVNNKLNLLLQNKLVGKQYLDNTQIAEKSIPTFNTTDLIITYRANFRRTQKNNLPIHFSAYFYNITNSLYENNGGSFSSISAGNYSNAVWVFPQAPFNVMFKVGLMF